MRPALGAIATLVVCVTLCGCRSDSVRPLPAGVTYQTMAERQNARVASIPRLWSRAVVSVDYLDREGERHYVQGDSSFFQLISPSRMALSVGKSGETFVWLGCDAERYWLIETKEHPQALVGRHDVLTPEKLRRLGLPAPPLDLFTLIGLSEWPAHTEPSAVPVVVTSRGRDVIRLDARRGSAVFRYLLDAKTRRPSTVSMLDERTGEETVVAQLDQYQGVETAGMGGSYPEMPTVIRIEQPSTGTVIKLSLSGMNDGVVNGGMKKGRLAAGNFDFDELLKSFGIRKIVDLDQQSELKEPDAE
ncbi:MAG TPA: hypothetical protein VG797_04730 [Phycisphaerales bacterium]|nr:hypothetical protein [Phycisphaerales bacterium]